jgi:hypothetical protein
MDPEVAGDNFSPWRVLFVSASARSIDPSPTEVNGTVGAFGQAPPEIARGRPTTCADAHDPSIDTHAAGGRDAS